jgi:hypothetical protein
VHFEENRNLAEDQVVALTSTSMHYLTALAIVDGTTIGDQVRSSVWEFINRLQADKLLPVTKDISVSDELRQPARVSFPVNLLESIERISTERDLNQTSIIDTALHRYIGRRLADPALESKIARRLSIE